jgi:hypothetical protein
MGHFEFGIEMLISLVGARPVLCNKKDNIFKDRMETKRAWRRIYICPQEDFEALGMLKNAFGEYCHTLWNKAD